MIETITARRESQNGLVPRCLIVDDLEENLLALEALLRDDPIEVVKARSGFEALELLLSGEFALALIDVQMPEMDGFELAELMRGAEKTRDIPIIFVTAGLRDRERVFKGYESGAVDFLYKPLDPHIVRSKIRVFSELYQKRIELQEARDRAERTSVLKTQFLANMSHEIRTPMNAILGFADLLSDLMAKEDPKFRYVSRIRENGDLLLRIIDDILDFSKLESGNFQVESEPFSIAQTIDETLGLLKALADKKGLKLRSSIAPGTPEAVTSDPLRLRQVLINLIGNSIKFTQSGHVEVRIRHQKPFHLVVEVEDTGIGMSSDESQGIFQPFRQADGSISRRFGGTGLGLSLSKRLAMAMGGDLSLMRSAPGEGSLFALTVRAPAVAAFSPVIIGSKSKSAQSSDGELNGKRILLAEDSYDNIDLISVYLERSGAELEVAHTGAEAYEAAMAKSYDLILMDVQMPIMDGLEATRRLREAGCPTPIIALTAHALKEEQDKSLAAGCVAHLTKPINRELLLSSLRAFLLGTGTRNIVH